MKLAQQLTRFRDICGQIVHSSESEKERAAILRLQILAQEVLTNSREHNLVAGDPLSQHILSVLVAYLIDAAPIGGAVRKQFEEQQFPVPTAPELSLEQLQRVYDVTKSAYLLFGSNIDTHRESLKDYVLGIRGAPSTSEKTWIQQLQQEGIVRLRQLKKLESGKLPVLTQQYLADMQILHPEEEATFRYDEASMKRGAQRLRMVGALTSMIAATVTPSRVNRVQNIMKTANLHPAVLQKLIAPTDFGDAIRIIRDHLEATIPSFAQQLQDASATTDLEYWKWYTINRIEKKIKVLHHVALQRVNAELKSSKQRDAGKP